jgi:hypothetical protein
VRLTVGRLIHRWPAQNCCNWPRDWKIEISAIFFSFTRRFSQKFSQPLRLREFSLSRLGGGGARSRGVRRSITRASHDVPAKLEHESCSSGQRSGAPSEKLEIYSRSASHAAADLIVAGEALARSIRGSLGFRWKCKLSLERLEHVNCRERHKSRQSVTIEASAFLGEFHAHRQKREN